MGMDPVKTSELCEVTIVLEGPVGLTALREFRAVIDQAIDQANVILDPDHGNARLKARVTRVIIR